MPVSPVSAGIGGTQQPPASTAATRRGCIRPFRLTCLVRTCFEEAAFRYASKIRHASRFPIIECNITATTTSITTVLLNPPAATRCSKTGLPSQLVRPTVHVPDPSPSTPQPQTWMNLGPWEEGDSIVWGIRQMRSQFDEGDMLIPRQQQVPPHHPPYASLQPSSHPTKEATRRRGRQGRPLPCGGGSQGHGPSQVQDKEDEWIDIEEVSPPRTTYHLYRISADGTSSTLPITVMASDSASFHNPALAIGAGSSITQHYYQSECTILPPRLHPVVTSKQQHSSLIRFLPHDQHQFPERRRWVSSETSRWPIDSHAAKIRDVVSLPQVSHYHREALKFKTSREQRDCLSNEKVTIPEFSEEKDVVLLASELNNFIEISSDSSPEVDSEAENPKLKTVVGRETGYLQYSNTSLPGFGKDPPKQESPIDGGTSKIQEEEMELPDLTCSPLPAKLLSEPINSNELIEQDTTNELCDKEEDKNIEDDLSNISTICFEDINLDEWTDSESEEVLTRKSNGGGAQEVVPAKKSDQITQGPTLVIDSLEVVTLSHEKTLEGNLESLSVFDFVSQPLCENSGDDLVELRCASEEQVKQQDDGNKCKIDNRTCVKDAESSSESLCSQLDKNVEVTKEESVGDEAIMKRKDPQVKTQVSLITVLMKDHPENMSEEIFNPKVDHEPNSLRVPTATEMLEIGSAFLSHSAGDSGREGTWDHATQEKEGSVTFREMELIPHESSVEGIVDKTMTLLDLDRSQNQDKTVISREDSVSSEMDLDEEANMQKITLKEGNVADPRDAPGQGRVRSGGGEKEEDCCKVVDPSCTIFVSDGLLVVVVRVTWREKECVKPMEDSDECVKESGTDDATHPVHSPSHCPTHFNNCFLVCHSMKICTSAHIHPSTYACMPPSTHGTSMHRTEILSEISKCAEDTREASGAALKEKPENLVCEKTEENCCFWKTIDHWRRMLPEDNADVKSDEMRGCPLVPQGVKTSDSIERVPREMDTRASAKRVLRGMEAVTSPEREPRKIETSVSPEIVSRREETSVSPRGGEKIVHRGEETSVSPKTVPRTRDRSVSAERVSRDIETSVSSEKVPRGWETSSFLEKVHRAVEANASPERVLKAMETSASPERAPRAMETSACPERVLRREETSVFPERAPRAVETSTPSERVPGREETSASPERAPRAMETSASHERVFRREETSASPKRVRRAMEKSASPERVFRREEISSSPERAPRAMETSASPERVFRREEKSASPERAPRTMETSSSLEGAPRAIETSAAPERVLRREETRASPERVTRAVETIASLERVSGREETGASPERVSGREETSASHERAPRAMETSASPERVPGREETSASPENVPRAMETSASPERVFRREETSASPERAPMAMETSASPERVFRREETSSSPDRAPRAMETIASPERVFRREEKIASPERASRAVEMNASPERAFRAMETSASPERAPRAMETSAPSERVLGRDETRASPERVTRAAETCGILERVSGREKTGASPERVSGREETSASPERVPGREETSASPERVPGAVETSASPERIPERETSASRERVPRAVETNAFPERVPGREEKSASPEIPRAMETSVSLERVLGAMETSASPERVPGRDEISASPERIPRIGKISFSPETVPRGGEISTSPETVPMGVETSTSETVPRGGETSASETVLRGGETNTSPETVPRGGEICTFPEIVPRGGETGTSETVPRVGERSISLETMPRGGETLTSPEIVPRGGDTNILETVPRRGETSTSPETVPRGGKTPTSPETVPKGGETSTPETVPRGGESSTFPGRVLTPLGRSTFPEAVPSGGETSIFPKRVQRGRENHGATGREAGCSVSHVAGAEGSVRVQPPQHKLVDGKSNRYHLAEHLVSLGLRGRQTLSPPSYHTQPLSSLGRSKMIVPDALSIPTSKGNSQYSDDKDVHSESQRRESLSGYEDSVSFCHQKYITAFHGLVDELRLMGERDLNYRSSFDKGYGGMSMSDLEKSNIDIFCDGIAVQEHGAFRVIDRNTDEMCEKTQGSMTTMVVLAQVHHIESENSPGKPLNLPRSRRCIRKIKCVDLTSKDLDKEINIKNHQNKNSTKSLQGAERVKSECENLHSEHETITDTKSNTREIRKVSENEESSHTLKAQLAEATAVEQERGIPVHQTDEDKTVYDVGDTPAAMVNKGFIQHQRDHSVHEETIVSTMLRGEGTAVPLEIGDDTDQGGNGSLMNIIKRGKEITVPMEIDEDSELRGNSIFMLSQTKQDTHWRRDGDVHQMKAPMLLPPGSVKVMSSALAIPCPSPLPPPDDDFVKRVAQKIDQLHTRTSTMQPRQNDGWGCNYFSGVQHDFVMDACYNEAVQEGRLSATLATERSSGLHLTPSHATSAMLCGVQLSAIVSQPSASVTQPSNMTQPSSRSQPSFVTRSSYMTQPSTSGAQPSASGTQPSASGTQSLYMTKPSASGTQPSYLIHQSYMTLPSCMIQPSTSGIHPSHMTQPSTKGTQLSYMTHPSTSVTQPLASGTHPSYLTQLSASGTHPSVTGTYPSITGTYPSISVTQSSYMTQSSTSGTQPSTSGTQPSTSGTQPSTSRTQLLTSETQPSMAEQTVYRSCLMQKIAGDPRDSSRREPRVTTTTTIQPSTSVTQLSTNVTYPLITVTQSSTSVIQPSASVTQPSTSGTQPSTSGTQPSTSGTRPSTSGTQPSSSGAQATDTIQPSDMTQPSAKGTQPSISVTQALDMPQPSCSVTQSSTSGTKPSYMNDTSSISHPSFILDQPSDMSEPSSHVTQPSDMIELSGSEWRSSVRNKDDDDSKGKRRWDEATEEEGEGEGPRGWKRRRRKGKGGTYHHVLEVPLTEVYEECVRVLAAAGECLLTVLRSHAVVGPRHRFLALQPDHTRSLLNQMLLNMHGRSQLNYEDKHYKNLLALHGLIKTTDILRHYGLKPAIHCLSEFHLTHQVILSGCYTKMKAHLERVQEQGGECVVHPKVMAVKREMERAKHKEDPVDTEFKVLVAVRREAQWVYRQLEEEFGSDAVALLSRLPEYDHVLRLLEHQSVVVWEEGEGLHQLPCSQFSLVVEWEGGGTSSICIDHCTRQNIHVVSLTVPSPCTDEREPPALSDSKNKQDKSSGTITISTTRKECRGGLKSRSHGKDIVTVVASNTITTNTELHHILTSVFSINLIERNIRDVMVVEGGRGWADLLLDERTCVILRPLAFLRSDAHLNQVTCQLVLLSLQCTTFYILLYSHPPANSGYEFRSSVMRNLTRLVAICVQFRSPEYMVSLLLTHNLHQVGEMVRELCEMARASSPVWDPEEWTTRPWLTSQMSSHERLLLSFPCINSISAQVILTAMSLLEVLKLPLSDLKAALPWVPDLVITMLYKLVHGETVSNIRIGRYSCESAEVPLDNEKESGICNPIPMENTHENAVKKNPQLISHQSNNPSGTCEGEAAFGTVERRHPGDAVLYKEEEAKLFPPVPSFNFTLDKASLYTAQDKYEFSVSTKNEPSSTNLYSSPHNNAVVPLFSSTIDLNSLPTVAVVPRDEVASSDRSLYSMNIPVPNTNNYGYTHHSVANILPDDSESILSSLHTFSAIHSNNEHSKDVFNPQQYLHIMEYNDLVQEQPPQQYQESQGHHEPNDNGEATVVSPYFTYVNNPSFSARPSLAPPPQDCYYTQFITQPSASTLLPDVQGYKWSENCRPLLPNLYDNTMGPVIASDSPHQHQHGSWLPQKQPNTSNVLGIAKPYHWNDASIGPVLPSPQVIFHQQE